MFSSLFFDSHCMAGSTTKERDHWKLVPFLFKPNLEYKLLFLAYFLI